LILSGNIPLCSLYNSIMKAFIVLALVACASARSVDLEGLLSKEKSLLREDWLLKDRLTNTHRFTNKGLLNSFDYPTTTFTPSVYGDEDSWTQRRVTILDLEELVQHPLFRVYLNIPLFRQFWEEHPVVFRKYVESPLFQQFWQHEQFIMYFRNPVLFYKYIYPQIQVIAQYVPETRFPYTHHKSHPYNYDVSDYLNTNTHSGYEREVTVGDYMNRIFGHGVDRTTYSPYTYGYTHSPVFGRHQYGMNQGVNYKFLLDKIYRTLFINKPVVGEVTQVRTDVKVAPAHKEVVVEPITGEAKVIYEPTKIVDVKVDEKIVPRDESVVSEYSYETKHMLKEALLKRLLITRHITPDMYHILRTLPLHQVKEIVRRIVSSPVDIESVFGDETTYPTRRHFNFDDIKVNNYDDVLYRHKINRIINNLYNNELVGERYTPAVRDLLNVLGHHTVRDVPSFDDIVRV